MSELDILVQSVVILVSVILGFGMGSAIKKVEVEINEKRSEAPTEFKPPTDRRP